MFRSITAALVFASIVSLGSARAAILGFNDPNGFTLTGADGTGNHGSASGDSNPSGVPGISGSTLTLTTQQSNESSSAFFNLPQNIHSFAASFNYQVTGSFDGFAFVLQNDPRGLNAIGGGGGDLGYGTDGSHPATAIGSSAAVLFTIGGTTGFDTGGSVANKGDNSVSFLGNGDVMNVHLTYNGTTLTETVTDSLNPTNTVTYNYAANIVSAVGGQTALVGFTGGTGGGNALQTVSNFQFATTPEPSSFILCGLGALGLFVVARRRKV